MDEPSTNRARLQFSLKTIFVFMAGLGFACVLAPQGFWPLQVYAIVYLLIGFGQVCYLLISWWRLRRESGLGPTPFHDAAALIQLGCWLTLPTWLLVVVWLIGDAWHCTPRGDFLAFVVAVWGLVALTGQLAGVIVNLINLLDCLRPIDGAFRRLALLNMAHTAISMAGFVAMGLLADGLAATR